MVLLSDGKGRGRPARLELTKDVLIIQITAKSGFFDETKDSMMELDTSIRYVKLRKKSDAGLGLSIKGGSDGNQQVPVVISKIFRNTPAEECGQLYLGDVIVEINGQSTDGKTHDEIVQILKDAGDEVTLTEECGQLYLGDVIVEINGQSTDGKTHDEIVQILKDAGDEVTLSVRHYIQIAPYLKFDFTLKLKIYWMLIKLSA
ncbi:unnamed protein product [Wuchereria bancrofti]|uniref:PDZ domain-containing protein n=1 Tax=Wuchereria bancrofti TaxID=6293 RepID=A0A3P7EER7_WUCBA|nr:unnamed protein product [Wuchereria bancrofti]